MKLDANRKKSILNAATHVYTHYVALDFFKTRVFHTGNNQLTLEQICENAIRDAQLKQTVTLNEQVFELELIRDEAVHGYKVSFKRPLLDSGTALRQPLNDYDDNEALSLLTQQDFSLQVDEAAKFHVANQLTEAFTIGGIGKVDLYRSHLVTLHNIIEKLSSEEDISNLLVALATGSGKTYVQALWMLVLSLSGNNAIFAVPDKLVAQLRNDLRRMLPHRFVDELLVLRKDEKNPAVEEILDDLKMPIVHPHIIIASSECLLDDHYQQLIEASSEHTFLSFDEQHLLMKSERRRVRLIELSKKMLTMFLTATPNQETYQLSGNQPVAIMSSGQKQAAGQGQFPVLFSENANNITDRNKLRDFRFWTAEFWFNLLRGIVLRFSNTIQQEQSSAAVSIVENLPFYSYQKPDEENVRWRLQVPMARKMLCIIDDNETLINFCHALDHSDRNDRSVYSNGNLVDRQAVTQFFQLPDVDSELIHNDLNYKREEYRDKLLYDELAVGEALANKSLKDQIKNNIFHNMMEYVLTDLTGLDEIEHNRLRKMDSAGFQALVRSKFVIRSAAYYQEKLARVIDPLGAQEIAHILNQISVQLGVMHRPQKMLDYRYDYTAEDFNAFVDNWALDDNIIAQCMKNNYRLMDCFQQYANEHLMISVMTGMQTSETPIKESSPFLGLKESRYHMYNDGILSNQAKRRQRTSLETLDDGSLESVFTPNYQEFNEEICDNYFRLGFVSVYVSNKKTEGFSDRNLHTVINIAENQLSTTNSPETLIQGIGRNRGLDDTIVPAYIHALGREQKTVFNLENLQSDDYYPALFKAQKSYHQQFIKVLGNDVGAEIIQWFRANVDKDETIDNDKLKKQVLKIIATSLRKLNNNNNHDIQLSRSHLTKVISEAMKILEQEIARINKPYKLSWPIKIIGSLLNFFCEMYYIFKRIKPAFQRLKHALFGSRSPRDENAVSTTHPDDVYLKILKKTDFKTMLADINVARELKDWVARKAAGVETSLRKNTEFYWKDDIREKFNQFRAELIAPLLSKFLIPSKHESILRSIMNMPNLIGFIEKNEATLLAICGGVEQVNVPEKILELLQQIPHSEAITLSDIINYPEQIKNDLVSFDKGPIALLVENNTLQMDTTRNLAAYLKGPFLLKASAFFLDADLNTLKGVLQHEDNTERFLTHLLSKTSDPAFKITDFRNIIGELKVFFQLDNLNTLEARATECMHSLTAEMTAIDQNPLANIKDEEITNIARTIKEELLCCLVNVYPLEARQGILENINLEQVKTLVKQEGAALMEIASGSQVALANGIFTKLVSTPLPKPLDLANEATRVQAILKQKLDDILSFSKGKLGIKKFFTASSWKGTIDNPQYIYDVPVAEMIHSNDFVNGISLLFSFNEWQDLQRKIKTDAPGRLALARALIDSQMKGTFQPEQLIPLINQSFSTRYEGTEACARRALATLQDQQQLLGQEPVQSLAPEALIRIAALMREKLIPLLAAFIQDAIVRANFLERLPVDNAKIVQFAFNNKETLARLQSGGAEQIKASALNLINQLLPPEQSLAMDSIINPPQHAEVTSTEVMKDIIEDVITTYLMSTHFAAFAEKALNHQDYIKLSLCLQDKEKVVGIAQKIANVDVQAITPAKLIAVLQEDEALKDIQSLDQRMTSFTDFMKEMQREGLATLDNNKISTFTAETLAPVLFHPEFYGSLKDLFGFLNKEDLTTLFEAMDKPEPREQATLIMDFIEVIHQQNSEELKEKFFTFADHDVASIDNLPFKKTMELLADIIEEVLNCQCYYNQHDKKGYQTSHVTPKLLEKISPELCDVRVDASYSFFSYFSRKVFFIQAIRNSLPRCAQVNADSNQSQVKILERVKSHILRPLWWSTSLSNIGYAIVKLARDVAFGLRWFGFAILNGLKSVINLFKKNTFTISSRNPISEDYNNTAFDMAKTINDLTPFDAPKVVASECPIDAVTGFEAAISKRNGPQFFTPATAAEDVGDRFDPIQNAL